MSAGGDGVVRAAGGVVWRRSPQGDVAVLLVHRPKYDDWSFPKGKCAAGEDDERCARREVKEETGFVCRLGEELPTTEYVDPKGRPKRVRYWAMTVESGRFEPSEEVDDIRWCPAAQAPAALSYSRDRDVLDALAASLDT